MLRHLNQQINPLFHEPIGGRKDQELLGVREILSQDLSSPSPREGIGQTKPIPYITDPASKGRTEVIRCIGASEYENAHTDATHLLTLNRCYPSLYSEQMLPISLL